MPRVRAHIRRGRPVQQHTRRPPYPEVILWHKGPNQANNEFVLERVSAFVNPKHHEQVVLVQEDRPPPGERKTPITDTLAHEFVHVTLFRIDEPLASHTLDRIRHRTRYTTLTRGGI